MAKLPEQGQNGQIMRYKGPAGEALSVDGALATFVADVLAGKITALRYGFARLPTDYSYDRSFLSSLFQSTVSFITGMPSLAIHIHSTLA